MSFKRKQSRDRSLGPSEEKWPRPITPEALGEVVESGLEEGQAQRKAEEERKKTEEERRKAEQRKKLELTPRVVHTHDSTILIFEKKIPGEKVAAIVTLLNN